MPRSCIETITTTLGEDIVVVRNSVKYSNEEPEQLRSRLLYQSRKRGIKENDLIFG